MQMANQDDQSNKASTAAQHYETVVRSIDIGQILSSKGPVVKCVLLRHMRSDGRDSKAHIRIDSTAAAATTTVAATVACTGSNALNHHQHHQHHHHHNNVLLMDHMDEIEVDTTPQKCHVQDILGGPFTFIGQYPDEGIVVIARRPLLPDNWICLPIRDLRQLCIDADISTLGIVTKHDLIMALEQSQLPINLHRLQPPLHNVVVRGDILLLRVADTDETLDVMDGDHDNDNDHGSNNDNGGGGTNELVAAEKEIKILSNDDFFLDYTLEEYKAFAARTDIVAFEPQPQLMDSIESVDDDNDQGVADGEDQDDAEHDEDVVAANDGNDEDGEDDDDEDDEDYVLGEDGVDVDEACGQVMLNFILGEVLCKFREENGRGPDTRELLDLRCQVAEQLGVEVATFDEDADRESKKRSAEHGSSGDGHSTKRVKFSEDTISGEEVADDDDGVNKYKCGAPEQVVDNNEDLPPAEADDNDKVGAPNETNDIKDSMLAEADDNIDHLDKSKGEKNGQDDVVEGLGQEEVL